MSPDSVGGGISLIIRRRAMLDLLTRSMPNLDASEFLMRYPNPSVNDCCRVVIKNATG